LNRIELILNRAGGTSEVKDAIRLDMERQSNVVSQQLKPRIGKQTSYIAAAPREKIINAEYFISICHKAFTEM